MPQSYRSRNSPSEHGLKNPAVSTKLAVEDPQAAAMSKLPGSVPAVTASCSGKVPKMLMTDFLPACKPKGRLLEDKYRNAEVGLHRFSSGETSTPSPGLAGLSTDHPFVSGDHLSSDKPRKCSSSLRCLFDTPSTSHMQTRSASQRYEANVLDGPYLLSVQAAGVKIADGADEERRSQTKLRPPRSPHLQELRPFKTQRTCQHPPSTSLSRYNLRSSPAPPPSSEALPCVPTLDAAEVADTDDAMDTSPQLSMNDVCAALRATHVATQHSNGVDEQMHDSDDLGNSDDDGPSPTRPSVFDDSPIPCTAGGVDKLELSCSPALRADALPRKTRAATRLMFSSKSDSPFASMGTAPAPHQSGTPPSANALPPQRQRTPSNAGIVCSRPPHASSFNAIGYDRYSGPPKSASRGLAKLPEDAIENLAHRTSSAGLCTPPGSAPSRDPWGAGELSARRPEDSGTSCPGAADGKVFGEVDSRDLRRKLGKVANAQVIRTPPHVPPLDMKCLKALRETIPSSSPSPSLDTPGGTPLGIAPQRGASPGRFSSQDGALGTRMRARLLAPLPSAFAERRSSLGGLLSSPSGSVTPRTGVVTPVAHMRSDLPSPPGAPMKMPRSEAEAAGLLGRCASTVSVDGCDSSRDTARGSASGALSEGRSESPRGVRRLRQPYLAPRHLQFDLVQPLREEDEVDGIAAM